MSAVPSKRSDNCLFCKIVAGDVPCKKIAESASTLAFLDIFPTAPGAAAAPQSLSCSLSLSVFWRVLTACAWRAGHALLIPKYCAEKLHELPPAAAGELGGELVKLARAVCAATGCSDYNVLQNNGEAAHQVVKHVHFHVIPKPSADKGLGVGWPSAKADEAALDEMLAKVLSAKKEADEAE